MENHRSMFSNGDGTGIPYAPQQGGAYCEVGQCFESGPIPPIWDSLVRVHPITEGSIILSWCVGWGMRTCWSTPMFLNSGCHLKAHLGSCEKILIPRPTPYHLNQTPQECVLSSQVISAYRSWESLSGTSGVHKELNTLTVRPSLFLPPSVYRLPSLGSGRKAGLEIKQ